MRPDRKTNREREGGGGQRGVERQNVRKIKKDKQTEKRLMNAWARRKGKEKARHQRTSSWPPISEADECFLFTIIIIIPYDYFLREDLLGVVMRSIMMAF